MICASIALLALKDKGEENYRLSKAIADSAQDDICISIIISDYPVPGEARVPVRMEAVTGS